MLSLLLHAIDADAPTKADAAKERVVWVPDKLLVEHIGMCNVACTKRWAEHSQLMRSNESTTVTVAAPEAGGTIDALPTVSEDLFGWNLEVTRHNIWYGLSAQLIANRLFATHDGMWVPRWTRIGNAYLGPSGASVSGHVGTHAIHCRVGARRGVEQEKPDQACGVRQRPMGGGWNSASGSKASGIALLAGRRYACGRAKMRPRMPSARGTCHGRVCAPF